MKSILKKVANICLLVSILVTASCEKNKTKGHSKDISYIKPPEWAQNAMNDECFSAVGVSNRKGRLTEIQKYAKNNAIDNLRTNIIVKFENLFLEESQNMPDDDKARLSMEINDNLKSKLTNNNLVNISQVYDTWKSPNSNILYVKVVASEKQVAYLIMDALDSLKNKYKNNGNILSLISTIKNDIFYNNFKSTREDRNKQMNDYTQRSNGVLIKNIVISKNSDGSPLANSTAEWTKQDDEIDKKIREAIELSEREGR